MPYRAIPRRLPLRLLASVLASVLAAAAASPLQASLPFWVPAGDGGDLMQYYLDADTVRRQRDLTYYRVFGRGVREVSRETTVESEVGVDCAQGRRVEYITTVRWKGGTKTTTASELEPVAPDSRQAQELAIACRLAESGPVAPAGRPGNVQIELGGPARPAEPARGQPITARWSGTAFAVAPQVLVTNHHVVRGCSRIQVDQGDGSWEARVLAADPRHDLAALTVAGGDFAPLELAPQGRELGEAIIVLGYPLANVLGSDLRVSTGIVSGLSGVGGDPRLLQISAPVQPGNSGGPVLTETGQVAAVVVTKMDMRMNTENVSFAVQLPPLRQFLAAHAIGHVTGRAGKAPVPVAQAVRRAAPSVLLVRCGA